VKLFNLKDMKNHIIMNTSTNRLSKGGTAILALRDGQVSTKEATFYTAIPAKYVVGYRGTNDKDYVALP
jgi:hypothetical protein